ncbi:MAG: TolC family protein, partial [Pseudomonadota bacterium]
MRIIACLAAAVSLAACATQSIEDADEMARGELPAAPKGWVVPIETPGAVAPGWIDRIGDPWLSELVRAAQEKNQDLRIAAANVERAKALLVQAGADRLPEISISASADALGNANASGTLTRSSFAGLAVVWELDVWGRIRAGRKATLASFISAEEDLRFAQYSIAATTAQTYFAAIEAQRQANVTAETLDALEETDRIVRTRYEEGEATAEDTALSRADVEATRASLAVDLANARAARRALELILADYPQGAIRIDTDFPAVPPTPAAGAPAELLAQRPDVLSASRQVAAASNFITQAQAARLPSITINGTY